MVSGRTCIKQTMFSAPKLGKAPTTFRESNKFVYIESKVTNKILNRRNCVDQAWAAFTR